jgi:hypothetical protein
MERVATKGRHRDRIRTYVDLGGLVVSVLATEPKVRGFDPDRGFFKGDKNPSVPCRRFTACKRNLRA